MKTFSLFLLLPTLTFGQTTVREVYNFSVGDTFQYKLTSCFYACSPLNEYENQYQFSISNKFYSVDSDSLYYVIERNWSSNHDTIIISNLDSLVLKAPYAHSYFYPTIIPSVLISMSGCFEVDTAFTDTCCNAREHAMAYSGCTGFDINRIANYVKGLGIYYMQTTNGEGGYNDPSQNWKLQLTYYSKGLEKWGSYTALSTAVDEISSNSNGFRLNPNPFSNQLTFALAGNAQTTILLFNFLGQQILQQTFTNSSTINTAQLADGIYFYELRNSKGTLKTGKVVKQ